MARRGTIAAVATLVALIGVPVTTGPAGASGGGGCGGPVTEGRGTAVATRKFCFVPTVLHASPGAEVSFTNADRAPHNVLGANGSWGSFEELRRRPAVYRFDEPGVYPYACSLHPGMVGTVVIGRAAPAGAGGTVTEVAAEPAPGDRVLRADPASTAPRASGDPWGIGAAGLGVVALGLGALLLRRRPPLGARGGHEPGAPS